MKISTIVFAISFLCLVCSTSCKKRSNSDLTQINAITATIGGTNYTFNYRDSLHYSSTPPPPTTVVGYGGSDTTDTIQNRIVIVLGTAGNPNSGAFSFRPAGSANVYSTPPGAFLPVNTVSFLNALAIGTFQGNIYLNGDTTQAKIIVTNGAFDVANH
jgi:hypothetical protein